MIHCINLGVKTEAAIEMIDRNVENTLNSPEIQEKPHQTAVLKCMHILLVAAKYGIVVLLFLLSLFAFGADKRYELL